MKYEEIKLGKEVLSGILGTIEGMVKEGKSNVEITDKVETMLVANIEKEIAKEKKKEKTTERSINSI